MPRLKGKVAAILSDEVVVINLGSDQKVSPGMRFVAVYETGAIFDPDSPQEALGSLTYEIATLTVKTVFAKMSICSVPLTPAGPTFKLPEVFQYTSKIDPKASRTLVEASTIKIGTVVIEAAPESGKTDGVSGSSTKPGG